VTRELEHPEVIAAFCAVGSSVQKHLGESEWGYTHAADCFCGLNPLAGKLDRFRYDEAVVAFVKEAVAEKIARGAST
jgi:hypothetical protein